MSGEPIDFKALPESIGLFYHTGANEPVVAELWHNYGPYIGIQRTGESISYLCLLFKKSRCGYPCGWLS